MANLSDIRINRALRIKDAKNVVSKIRKTLFNRNDYFKSYGSFYEGEYEQSDRTTVENDNLDKLVNLYEKLRPDWIVNFNDFEKNRKDIKYSAAGIKKDTSLLEVVEGVKENDLDNASVLAMNMYIANKIAHTCGIARDRIVEGIMVQTCGEHISQEDFTVKKASKLIKKYFIAKNKNDISKMRRMKQYLRDFEIENDEIEQLDRLGISELIQMEMDIFAIKDLEMMNLITRLQERDRIQETEIDSDEIDPPMSYGIKEDDKGNRLMVVDLPFFGQFSVHMRDPMTISALSDTEYNKFVYARESVMLTEDISPIAKEDWHNSKGTIEGIKKVAMDRMKGYGKRDKLDEVTRYAHHLTLKSGGSKKELDDIYDGR